MPDHYFASVATAKDFEGSDDDLFDLVSGTTKAKPTPNKILERLPLTAIREALESNRVYDAPRGSPEFIHQLHADTAACPLCRYENFDRYELGKHIVEHEEIQQFRQSMNRLARSLEQMTERRFQILETQERLRGELKILDDKIRKFDRKSLRAREAQVNELSRLVNG